MAKNFATSTVVTAPTPATSGTTLTLTAGHGDRFDDPATSGPYPATISPRGLTPTPTNAEIVTVTARTGDTLTITRAQEDTSARTVLPGDQVTAGLTAAQLATIRSDIQDRYTKPGTGIPAADLTTGVQASLTRADNALPAAGGTLTGALTLPSGVVNPGTVAAAVTTGFPLGALGIGGGGRRRKWAPASSAQLFQSGHAWTTTGTVVGSNLADTTNNHPGIGGQCVSWSTNGAGTFGGVKLIGGASTDLAGKAIRVTFRLPASGFANFSSLYLYVGSSNLANYFTFKIAQETAGIDITNSGEWMHLTVGWADVTAAAGTYTLTNGTPSTKTGFTDWRIQANDTSSGTGTTIHLQGVEVVAEPSTPLIAVTFDDTWRSSLLGVQYLYQKGAPATLYTIAEMTDPANVATRLTVADLLALQESGCEIAGHAFTTANHNAGLTSLTAAQADAELRHLKAWQVTAGFSSDHFAYPLGQFAATTDGVPLEQVVRRYYPGSARTITPSPLVNHMPPAQPHRLFSRSGISGYAGGTSVATLTATGGVLDRIAQHGGLYVACFHEITSGAAGSTNQCSIADFQALIDNAVSRGFTFVTAESAMRNYA